MPQTITVVDDLLDRGVGIDDISSGATAATDTDLTFANDGNMILFIINASGAPITATLNATPDPYGRGGAGVNDEAITVPAGETGYFPFMNLAMFQSGGSAATSVTLSVFASVSVRLARITKSR